MHPLPLAAVMCTMGPPYSEHPLSFIVIEAPSFPLCNATPFIVNSLYVANTITVIH